MPQPEAPPSTTPRTGLLLTGGGARAAYQVGVLEAVLVSVGDQPGDPVDDQVPSPPRARPARRLQPQLVQRAGGGEPFGEQDTDRPPLLDRSIRPADRLHGVDAVPGRIVGDAPLAQPF